jgi:hypothetical protein
MDDTKTKGGKDGRVGKVGGRKICNKVATGEGAWAEKIANNGQGGIWI